MQSERSGPGIPRLDRAVSKEAMLASSESERALAEFLLALTLCGDAAFVNPERFGWRGTRRSRLFLVPAPGPMAHFRFPPPGEEPRGPKEGKGTQTGTRWMRFTT